jgi:hypothetical protein
MGQKFYFFTDPALLAQQTPAQAYGPQGYANGKDVFQTTDIHVASSTAPAFAICDGLIAAQLDNSGTMTIVLKPSAQPPFEFPFISYFIYKGIDPVSLLSTDGRVKTTNASTNQLVAAIKKAWELPDNNNGNTAPSRDCLGLHLNTIDYPLKYPDDPKSDRFADSAPLDRLGEFSAAGFGLDITVDRISHRPQIKLTRVLQNLIEVDSLDSSVTFAVNNASYFKHWHNKEECLSFVDPCALWGNASASALHVWNGTKFEKKETSEIYEAVLVGTHDDTNPESGNFFNRNFAYLDLRNEHGNSLNYYKADGPLIQLTLEADSDIDDHEVNYYAAGWPCFRIGNAQLPQNYEGTFIDVRLGLPRTNYASPLIYISVGYRGDLNKLKHGQRFIDHHRRADLPYLEEASITILLYSATPKVAAGYSKIFLFKRPLDVDGVALSSTVDLGLAPPSTDFLDNLFQIPDLSEEGPNAATVFRTFADERYVVAPTAEHGGFAANITFAEDSLNYYWLLAPTAYYTWPGTNASFENATTLPTLLLSSAKNFLLQYVAQRSVKDVRTEILEVTTALGSQQTLAIAAQSAFETRPKKPKIFGSEHMVALAVSKNSLVNIIATTASNNPLPGTMFLLPAEQERFTDQGRVFKQLKLSSSFIGEEETVSRQTEQTSIKLYQHVGD